MTYWQIIKKIKILYKEKMVLLNELDVKII